VVANNPPTISLTSPSANQDFTAPANVTITASADDPDHNLARVEFFQNGTLIATLLNAPFTATWNDVAAGTYSITAVATDAAGAQTISAAVSITVSVAQASLYFIQADHLNTPRLITDASNAVVWRNLPTGEPFGTGPVEDDPGNTGHHFVFNLRFPGQYADMETKLAYNAYRDYDPATGRYQQSDPIGLAGGVGTYTYVNGNPVSRIDPLGLAHCVYSISSGRMTCISDSPELPGFGGDFASGNNRIPGCKNNPNCIDKKETGPIPTGWWYWDQDGQSAKPGGRVLEPLQVDAKNRTDIRTHSCKNPFGPSTKAPYCSAGCVTGTPDTISGLNEFLGQEWASGFFNTLQVVK